MIGEDRLRVRGFEIQHIIPLAVLNSHTPAAKAAREFLKNVKFDFEDRGNKIALLVTPAVRDSVKKIPSDLLNSFSIAGFGWNTHDSRSSDPSHSGHISFVMNTPVDFARRAKSENWDSKICERAFYDLHEFLYKKSIRKEAYL